MAVIYDTPPPPPPVRRNYNWGRLLLYLGLGILGLLLLCSLCGGIPLNVVNWFRSNVGNVRIQPPIAIVPAQVPTSTPSQPALVPTATPNQAYPTAIPTLIPTRDMALPPATIVPPATPVPLTPIAPTTMPPATSAPASPPQGKVEKGTDGIVRMSVVNPDAPDQVQVRHPVAYSQSNVSGAPIKYSVDVPQGYVLIAGAFRIDSLQDGVYVAKAPGHYEFTITDGFALIIRENWSREEWIFRLDQATQFGWAKTHVDVGPIK